MDEVRRLKEYGGLSPSPILPDSGTMPPSLLEVAMLHLESLMRRHWRTTLFLAVVPHITQDKTVAMVEHPSELAGAVFQAFYANDADKNKPLRASHTTTNSP
jgi:hypothetical protein